MPLESEPGWGPNVDAHEEEVYVFPERRECSREEFLHYAQEIERSLLNLVQERCDFSGEGFDFHKRAHTQGVIDRTERIVQAMQSGGLAFSDEDLAFARVLAAGHDTVQEWEPVILPKEGLAGLEQRIRRRKQGENERQSGGDIRARMKAANEQAKKTIFCLEDARLVQETMHGTIPGWDSETKTVIQPNVTEASSSLARAVALADLGEAGMDPDGFLENGLGLFREEKLDMRIAAYRDDLSDSDRAFHVRRMQGWIELQVAFAEGRQKLLAKELHGLPETVLAEFSQFPETIRRTRARAEEWREYIAVHGEAASFAWCCERMGYQKQG